MPARARVCRTRANHCEAFTYGEASDSANRLTATDTPGWLEALQHIGGGRMDRAVIVSGA